MSYHPIHDLWFLARCKYQGGVKRYGGYPGGFPERARALLGVTLSDPVLHVCGGLVRHYPYPNAIGPNDRTLDLDPATEPDFLQDARDPFPSPLQVMLNWSSGWPAILMDPPYSEEDAEHYAAGADRYPSPNLLLKNSLDAVRPGGRVGLLHYVLPSPPSKKVKFVAAAGVVVGFNNRVRVFSVFERPTSE
jgi:hypothetical protein